MEQDFLKELPHEFWVQIHYGLLCFNKQMFQPNVFGE